MAASRASCVPVWPFSPSQLSNRFFSLLASLLVHYWSFFVQFCTTSVS